MGATCGPHVAPSPAIIPGPSRVSCPNAEHAVPRCPTHPGVRISRRAEPRRPELTAELDVAGVLERSNPPGVDLGRGSASGAGCTPTKRLSPPRLAPSPPRPLAPRHLAPRHLAPPPLRL